MFSVAVDRSENDGLSPSESCGVTGADDGTGNVNGCVSDGDVGENKKYELPSSGEGEEMREGAECDERWEGVKGGRGDVDAGPASSKHAERVRTRLEGRWRLFGEGRVGGVGERMGEVM